MYRESWDQERRAVNLLRLGSHPTMFISHASLQSWNRKGILGQIIYHMGDGIDRRRCKEVSCWVYTGRVY